MAGEQTNTKVHKKNKQTHWRGRKHNKNSKYKKTITPSIRDCGIAADREYPLMIRCRLYKQYWQ